MTRYIVLTDDDPQEFLSRDALKAYVRSDGYEGLHQIVTAGLGYPCEDITEEIAREIYTDANKGDAWDTCHRELGEWLSKYVDLDEKEIAYMAGEEDDPAGDRADRAYDDIQSAKIHSGF